MSASQVEGWVVRSTAAERIAVTLLGQKRSPQPPRQEAQFRLRPATNFRHKNKKKNPKPKGTIFFLILTKRLVDSAEGLNSSLAQSTGELWSCKKLQTLVEKLAVVSLVKGFKR